MAALKNALIETICSVFITRKDQSRTKSGITTITRHHRLFHDALDIIKDNICQELTVGKLCDELTTSRRTLEYVFKENIKMSPARYIRALRLNNIRREIMSREPGTLGDIAAKWGIWHLGRFSRDYYATFWRTSLSDQRACRQTLTRGPGWDTWDQKSDTRNAGVRVKS